MLLYDTSCQHSMALIIHGTEIECFAFAWWDSTKNEKSYPSIIIFLFVRFAFMVYLNLFGWVMTKTFAVSIKVSIKLKHVCWVTLCSLYNTVSLDITYFPLLTIKGQRENWNCNWNWAKIILVLKLSPP